MDTGTLAKAISKGLGPAGFKRSGLTWRLRGEEVIAVVNLQKSRFGNDYFLNLGFWLVELGDAASPKEEQCHIRARAERVWSKSVPSLSDALDSDCAMTDEDRVRVIGDFVCSRLVPFISGALLVQGLREIVRQSDEWVLRQSARAVLEV